jgi:putative hydrolase of the HAD superfamily
VITSYGWSPRQTCSKSKIARSGLAPLFERIEIVSEKDQITYQRLLARHGIGPDEFLMVGNSLRSDVLPVIAAGAQAIPVPYEITWEHEAVGAEDNTFHWTIPNLRALLDITPA